MIKTLWSFNSSRPNEAIWHHASRSTSVQVMACDLFSAKPLPETMLTYGWIRTYLGANFIDIALKIQIFSFNKINLKMFAKCGPFSSSLNMITNISQDHACRLPVDDNFMSIFFDENISTLTEFQQNIILCGKNILLPTNSLWPGIYIVVAMISANNGWTRVE